MSFAFNWPRSFPASFYESAKTSLDQALNSGQKLPLVADKIRVVDLHLGTIPPELDLLGIDELSTGDDGFSGRFMLSYSGDAFVSLATNLHVSDMKRNVLATNWSIVSDMWLRQVNPLTQYKHALEMLATPSVLLTTAEMFVQLTLSHLRLRCVVSMSFSKTNGLALTFKDDPLESLTVSSSFDSFSVVQQFIQSVSVRITTFVCYMLYCTYAEAPLHQCLPGNRESTSRALPTRLAFAYSQALAAVVRRYGTTDFSYPYACTYHSRTRREDSFSG